MKHAGTFRLVLLVAACLCAPLARAGELVDRVVVRVDKNVITQSEWDEAVRLEMLSAGRIQRYSAEERESVLERLIDQQLLQQQMRATITPDLAGTQVEAQIETVRRVYPEAASSEGWKQVLARYGLTESEVRERLAAQLTILRFIDERFRPSIRIPRDTVEKYYNERYVPEIQRANGKIAPLQEVRSTIEELLIQQRIDEALNTWLESLRAQTRIVRVDRAHADALAVKESK
jgi:hypothetical protein